MKYVAFLDILGFKNRLRHLTQAEARRYIARFTRIAKEVWDKLDTSSLSATFVSDSSIIYTDDCSEASLKQLISVIDGICKAEFRKCGVLLRGAIAKGDFDQIRSVHLDEDNLTSELIVGQAYVDAYLLEGTVKAVGIVLSGPCYEDFHKYGFTADISMEKTNDMSCHVYHYLTIDFLSDRKNFAEFIRLAKESGWMAHYYNTIGLAIEHERKDRRVYQFFDEIIDIIEDGKPQQNWRELDLFIRNAFQPAVTPAFTRRFLKYLRVCIRLSDTPQTKK